MHKGMTPPIGIEDIPELHLMSDSLRRLIYGPHYIFEFILYNNSKSDR